MQGQSLRTFLDAFRLNPRRRAILIGALMALAGLAILLWPHARHGGVAQGDDVASLGQMVNLPAVPLLVHWSVGPMAGTDSEPPPGTNDWSLDATMVFSPTDAAGITGAEVFYKAPLLSGKLMRVDDTHFRLILNTRP